MSHLHQHFLYLQPQPDQKMVRGRHVYSVRHLGGWGGGVRHVHVGPEKKIMTQFSATTLEEIILKLIVTH